LRFYRSYCSSPILLQYHGPLSQFWYSDSDFFLDFCQLFLRFLSTIFSNFTLLKFARSFLSLKYSCCMCNGLFDRLWSDAWALALVCNNSRVRPRASTFRHPDVLSSAMASSKSEPFFLSFYFYYFLTTKTTVLHDYQKCSRDERDAYIDRWFMRVQR
jgi:hypothetical protein